MALADIPPEIESFELNIAAIAYAQAGLYVVPCRGKHPTLLVPPAPGQGGYKLASNDPEQIAEWWERWPDAGIGYRPGPSGLLVVDLDGPTGIAEWDELSRGRTTPPTLVVLSPGKGGGRHLIYEHPVAAKRVGHTHPAPGVEVFGWKHHLMLPPSIHPDTGTPYRFDGELTRRSDRASQAREEVAA